MPAAKTQTRIVQLGSVPRIFEPLYGWNGTYAVLYGGRGSGKSETVADYYLKKIHNHSGKKVLCVREVEVSIRKSVYATFEIVARRLGIYQLYTWKPGTGEIISKRTGSTIIFAGLFGGTVNNIKSIPGITDCWGEEAQCISQLSWDILIPTILRNNGAQIIMTLNPDHEDDAVYAALVLGPDDENHLKIPCNLDDNPYATDAMKEERRQAYIINESKANHIWGGACVSITEGAIYAKQFTQAERAGRIGHYPRKEGAPCYFAFDIGGGSQSSDHMSVVSYQYLNGERRYWKAWQTRGETIGYHCDVIHRLQQDDGISIGGIYLPHDARHHHAESYDSTEDIVRRSFPGVDVDVVERAQSVVTAIEYVRDKFSECTFDADGAKELIHSLRRYSWAKNKAGDALHPLHDSHSDISDAFRASIVHAMPSPVKKPSTPQRAYSSASYNPF